MFESVINIPMEINTYAQSVNYLIGRNFRGQKPSRFRKYPGRSRKIVLLRTLAKIWIKNTEKFACKSENLAQWSLVFAKVYPPKVCTNLLINRDYRSKLFIVLKTILRLDTNDKER